MIDEFKAFLEQLKANKQHLNTQFDNHSGFLKAEELTKILQKAASAEFDSGEQTQANCGYVCSALFDKTISDEQKLALYQT